MMNQEVEIHLKIEGQKTIEVNKIKIMIIKKEFDFGFHNNDNDNKKEFGFGFHNNDNDRNNDKNDNDFYNNIHDHKDFGDNERMFNNLDRNNNSVLSRNEIMDGFNLNSRQADELMDKMDENRDGYINKEEFNNYMNNNF